MSLAYQEQTWAVHAACADVDPDSLFVRGAAQRQVRNVCFSCQVRLECLADALDSNASFGVWGGLTERERRAILRMFPDEENWFDRLTNSEEQMIAELRAGRVPRLN
ncbi:WhiB family transcriptional regulator [Arcanobacterium phocisimile]|uniref:Transcriptional regulator WhiB n=1 Tax=Arcanobacterium phocisimile TaxID=1302235 RepID=A0ABX7IG53_9ACTO|nr:WhiB family transcriptional regulator [Arcanobacterium phocisimile]QRV02096.1 WhiB family transcriptional regulator [Arcanobacterium phocisimile]